jgi:succinoglycan biosynthesis protein ExoA
MILKDPKVSIICPIRNEEHYIEECLKSLLSQTYPLDKIQIIIVDGMSDDGTRQVVKKYAEKNKSILLLSNPRKTVPYALNIALEHTSGDIVIRVDGHARIAQEYVTKCIEFLNKTGADCVGGRIYSMNNSLTGKAIAIAMSSSFGVGGSRFRTSQRPGFVDTLAFGAYRKQVFSRIGTFDTGMVRCQDDEFNYRLRKSGGRIYFTPEIQSWYYPRSSFRKLMSQYYGYGYYKVRVFQKYPRLMQPRHFAPMLLVFSMSITAVGGFYRNSLSLFFLWIIVLYFILALLASIISTRRNHLTFFAAGCRVFTAFLILHIGYGLGFVVGNVRFFRNWVQRENESTA